MQALFTLQIILLVVGLGAGYWFLIMASTYENRLKMIGEIFGWVTIAMTAILAIFNFFYSMNILNDYSSSKQIYYPINPPLQQQQLQLQQQQQQQTNPPLKNEEQGGPGEIP